jgi:hypothetical protein
MGHVGTGKMRLLHQITHPCHTIFPPVQRLLLNERVNLKKYFSVIIGVLQLLKGAILFKMQFCQLFVQKIDIHSGIRQLLLPMDDFNLVGKTFVTPCNFGRFL